MPPAHVTSKCDSVFSLPYVAAKAEEKVNLRTLLQVERFYSGVDLLSNTFCALSLFLWLAASS